MRYSYNSSSSYFCRSSNFLPLPNRPSFFVQFFILQKIHGIFCEKFLMLPIGFFPLPSFPSFPPPPLTFTFFPCFFFFPLLSTTKNRKRQIGFRFFLFHSVVCWVFLCLYDIVVSASTPEGLWLLWLLDCDCCCSWIGYCS